MKPARNIVELAPVGQALPPDALAETIRRAQDHLLSLQHAEGYWVGELEVDCTLCADYIAYMHWRGRVDDPLQEKCAAHVRRRQLPDGGWNIYVDGPSELNASVKAYFALKLAGDSPEASWMREARANILRLGGIPQMNTYGKLYLALLGQFPWVHLPAIPAEFFLLPKWFFFNLYEMSSWTRTIIAPLGILNHYKPTRELPAHLHIHELYPAGVEGSNLSLKRDRRFWSWRNFFLRVDRVIKFYERHPIPALRKLALRATEKWMTDRMGPGSGGLSAIYPAMLNSMMALQCLGYPADHPLVKKADADFAGLFVDDPQDFRIQPCVSPVWDTAITTIALGESGVAPTHPALQRAAVWLENKEVRHLRGDWAETKNKHPEASGWAFEFDNDYYPDTDDTMMVLMALRLTKPKDAQRHAATQERALRWLLSFQCDDGGWAAFDKNVTRRWLEDVPFADHNAILDPTCSDLTARVLELLGKVGFSRDHRQVQRALAQIKRTQEADGSWYGRWGVNYIYGTWQILRGLASIGEDMTQPWVQRGRDWLESCQNEDGGWGETCASYDDPALKGRGPSTASQTAWAVMGLCACGDPARASIQAGIRWLIRQQDEDGSWPETATTGTGFPCVFYLKYDMYRRHFPLLALATYQKLK